MFDDQTGRLLTCDGDDEERTMSFPRVLTELIFLFSSVDIRCSRVLSLNLKKQYELLGNVLSCSRIRILKFIKMSLDGGTVNTNCNIQTVTETRQLNT